MGDTAFRFRAQASIVQCPYAFPSSQAVDCTHGSSHSRLGDEHHGLLRASIGGICLGLRDGAWSSGRISRRLQRYLRIGNQPAMPRYKLRTLLIVLTIAPPVLAWAWFNRVPLALVLAVCLLGTVIGLTLLWGIEGLLAVAASLIAPLRRATRRKKRENEGEFSLSRFATEVKA